MLKDFLVVPWLRLGAFTAGGLGSMPSLKLRPCHTTTINTKKKFFFKILALKHNCPHELQ